MPSRVKPTRSSVLCEPWFASWAKAWSRARASASNAPGSQQPDSARSDAPATGPGGSPEAHRGPRLLS